MNLDNETYWLNRLYLVLGGLIFGIWILPGMVRVLGWPLAVVFLSPPIASILSYWAVQHGADGLGRWWRQLLYRGTNGSYHAFDDLPVRVRWTEGACAVAVQDVLNVMRLEADERTIRRLAFQYPGDGLTRDETGEWWFSELAVLDWLNRKARQFDERAHRFHRWLERETFPPLRRKAELGRLPE